MFFAYISGGKYKAKPVVKQGRKANGSHGGMAMLHLKLKLIIEGSQSK